MVLALLGILVPRDRRPRCSRVALRAEPAALAARRGGGPPGRDDLRCRGLPPAERGAVADARSARAARAAPREHALCRGLRLWCRLSPRAVRAAKPHLLRLSDALPG